MNTIEAAALAEEQEDNRRLEKMREALASYREAENEARRALARAMEATKTVKEKHDTLFAENEKRAIERRKSGRITNQP